MKVIFSNINNSPVVGNSEFAVALNGEDVGFLWGDQGELSLLIEGDATQSKTCNLFGDCFLALAPQSVYKGIVTLRVKDLPFHVWLSHMENAFKTLWILTCFSQYYFNST